MVVQELTKQAVVHASGAIVASTDRFAFTYARDGRSLTIAVEPLETYYVRLPASPVWSDGQPLAALEAQQLQADLIDTFQHWGMAMDFVYPDDPRRLHGLEELVAYIRSQSGAVS